LAILQNVPRMINGKIVNSIFVNAKGEAVYTGYKEEGSFIQPLSPTAIRFGGKLAILGGTGKFANASGEGDFLGQFNPQNQDDAWYTVNGWISY
ncbi:MAG TPA: hypothetical protein VLL95_05660, partial [Phnomibacter sp.]|nr:hypothetical protein [Phnomibacter sp.]